MSQVLAVVMAWVAELVSMLVQQLLMEGEQVPVPLPVAVTEKELMLEPKQGRMC